MIFGVSAKIKKVKNIRTQQSWSSMHQSYIQYAVESCLSAGTPKEDKPVIVFDARPTIETIIYSFLAIEATLEFMLHLGDLKHFAIKAPDNWLTRYVGRKSRNLKIGDRLGLSAYAWRGEPFWTTPEQYTLFCELRHARNGLTHSRPYGFIEESEITDEGVDEHGIGWECSSSLSRKPIRRQGLLTIDEPKPLATFTDEPGSLSKDDAEKALEIMVYHLLRMRKLFFNGRKDTWFAYADGSGKIRFIETILEQLSLTRFKKYWPEDQVY